MKKRKKYSLVVLIYLLSIPTLLLGQDHLQTAQKTITKQITIGNNGELVVNNQYGDVTIKRWKFKSALVQVTITGQSAELARANALIRYVKIKTGTKDGTAGFETIIDTASQHIDPSSGEQCHINFTLFVPRGLKLCVSNRFGNIYIKSFDGDLTVDERFGDLKVGHIAGSVKFNVQQGNTDIDHFPGGLLNLKGFNTVRVGELAGNVDAQFSSGGKVDLGLTGDLLRLNLVADNVRPIILTNLKIVNADLKIHSTLSKTIYNGRILLKLLPLKISPQADSLASAKRDTSQKSREKLLDLKKLSLNVSMMKNQEFRLKTGHATTEISIKASFCVVEITD